MKGQAVAASRAGGHAQGVFVFRRALRLAAAVGATLSATLLAGCSEDTSGEDGARGRSGDDPRAEVTTAPETAQFWNSSTIYFLLTDRFQNGDPTNDRGGRPGGTAVLRGFEGGDLRGVIQKLAEGYFQDLSVDAIWMTPFWEQIRGSTNEGTGVTQGYHGYWALDWTRVDPSLGTNDELAELVELAHSQGIRVILDAVIQHTGPVTDQDPVWTDWVRTEPQCSYGDYTTTVDCTLVANLPDVLTDSDDPVELPAFLLEKWRVEGRAEAEVAELEAWFAETGYPRAPRYYIMKWLTDWVREMGFDAYRVDTVKHFEESVSAELAAEGARAFEDWKGSYDGSYDASHDFWMMGEVYGYGASGGRDFDFGDRTVDYFAHGYDALINFGFKAEAQGSYADLEAMYARYADLLRDGDLRGVSIVNYAASHDDGSPMDPDRMAPMETGTRLLLAPGGAQIYYGDETARPLQADGATGDANLRTMMNWDQLAVSIPHSRTLDHWRKVARFRSDFPEVGAGDHAMIQQSPYVFSRSLDGPGVVIGMGFRAGPKTVPVGDVFDDGSTLMEHYSGEMMLVRDGQVTLDTPADLVLLSAATRQR